MLLFNSLLHVLELILYASIFMIVISAVFLVVYYIKNETSEKVHRLKIVMRKILLYSFIVAIVFIALTIVVNNTQVANKQQNKDSSIVKSTNIDNYSVIYSDTILQIQDILVKLPENGLFFYENGILSYLKNNDNDHSFNLSITYLKGLLNSDLDSVMNEYVSGLTEKQDIGITYKVLSNSQIPLLRNFNDFVSKSLRINLTDKGSFIRILYILRYGDYVYFLKFDISNLDSHTSTLSKIISSIKPA